MLSPSRTMDRTLLGFPTIRTINAVAEPCDPMKERHRRIVGRHAHAGQLADSRAAIADHGPQLSIASGLSCSRSCTEVVRIEYELHVGAGQSEGFLRILGDPPAGTEHDRLADLLSASTAPASPVLGRVLAAAWRAALVAVAEGSDPQQARAALLALEFRLSS